MRRAFPVIRIRLKIENLLRVVVAHEFKGSGSQRVRLLTLVAIFGDDCDRNQIRQQTYPGLIERYNYCLWVRRFDALNVTLLVGPDAFTKAGGLRKVAGKNQVKGV